MNQVIPELQIVKEQVESARSAWSFDAATKFLEQVERLLEKYWKQWEKKIDLKLPTKEEIEKAGPVKIQSGFNSKKIIIPMNKEVKKTPIWADPAPKAV